MKSVSFPRILVNLGANMEIDIHMNTLNFPRKKPDRVHVPEIHSITI